MVSDVFEVREGELQGGKAKSTLRSKEKEKGMMINLASRKQ